MSKQIHVGKVAVGGGTPVSIQSMCNTHTEDTPATVAQILRLEQAGTVVAAAGDEERHPHADAVGDVALFQVSVVHSMTSFRFLGV